MGMWGWALLAPSSTASLCCEHEHNEMCITCIIHAFLSNKAEKELTFCLLNCTQEETLFLLMQIPFRGWDGSLLSLGLAITGSFKLQENLIAALTIDGF